MLRSVASMKISSGLHGRQALRDLVTHGPGDWSPQPIQIPYTCSSGMLIVLRQSKPSCGGESGPVCRACRCRQGETVLMSITTAMTSAPKPAPELIEAFRGAPTSVISDNLARLPGAVGLKSYHGGGKLVGAAFTVRTRPGDNLAIHRALELVGPGDVIVVDGGGDETRALVGEIMKNIAQWRKAEGYVIDGA